MAPSSQLQNKSQGDRNHTRSHALRNERWTEVIHNPYYHTEIWIDLNEVPGAQHERRNYRTEKKKPAPVKSEEGFKLKDVYGV